MNVGQLIAQYLEKHEMSQSRLSALAKLPRQALTRCIKHGQNPTRETLDKLLRAMDRLTGKEKIEMLKAHEQQGAAFVGTRRKQGKEYRKLLAAKRLGEIYKPVFHCDVEVRIFPERSKRINRGKFRLPVYPYLATSDVELTEEIGKKLHVTHGETIGIAAVTLAMWPEENSKAPYLRWRSVVIVGRQTIEEEIYLEEERSGQWFSPSSIENTALMNKLVKLSGTAYENVRLGLLQLALQGVRDGAAYSQRDSENYFSLPRYLIPPFACDVEALQKIVHAKKIDPDRLKRVTAKISQFEAEVSSYHASIPASLDGVDRFTAYFQKAISRLP